MQDGSAYNLQNSNLTNPKPDPNPLNLTVSL